MASYKYKAQTGEGKTVSGKMQALNEKDLHSKLRERGQFLLSAEPELQTKGLRPLKSKELAEFARQLGTLVGSGVSLVRALKIITEEETFSAKERAVYEAVHGLVRQGIPLSEALEEQGDVFPPLLINMFRSAEVSGNLDQTALRMATHYDKEHRLTSKVKSSMIYPKILGFLIVVVVVIIMSYVIPQFQTMFDQMDSLPVTTTVLLAISAFVKKYWIGIAIAVVIAYVALQLVFHIPKVRYAKDRMLVHLPLLGKLEKIIFTARFARTLSSLYSSGIPIVTALEIARKTIGNYYIDSQFDEVITQVRTGGSLSDALGEVDGLTKKLVSSVRIGEETGSLDSMLNSTADNLDYEAEVAIGRMVSYLEPVMIVIMAVIVGFIMIAVIKPIYGSYETIGKSSY